MLMSLFLSFILFNVMTEAQLVEADQLLLCKCSQHERIRYLLVKIDDFPFLICFLLVLVYAFHAVLIYTTSSSATGCPNPTL
jgi:hypothetical protein